MKSLTTLIKLQKTYVDEQRTQVARLQENLAQIGVRIAELEIQKTREQLAAQQSHEARATYGFYLKGAVAKGRQLEKERQAAVKAIEIARDKLAELFEEQKRYEIAEADRIAKAKFEEQHKERQRLDEIGSISHARRKD